MLAEPHSTAEVEAVPDARSPARSLPDAQVLRPAPLEFGAWIGSCSSPAPRRAPMTKEAVEEALVVLRSRADVRVACTGDVDELREVLGGRDGRDVVVAGGDGSLHAVVGVLFDAGDLSGPTIGLIPLGTGNDFASGVGIPSTGRGGRRDRRATAPPSRSTCWSTTSPASSSTPSISAWVPTQPAKAKPWKKRLGKASYLVELVKAGVKARRGTSFESSQTKACSQRAATACSRSASAMGPTSGGGTALAPQGGPDGRRGRCRGLVRRRSPRATAVRRTPQAWHSRGT